MPRDFQAIQSLFHQLERMSDFEIVLGLIVVAALSSFLYLKHQRRVRARLEARQTMLWQGTPIEVSKLKPTLQAVRQDFRAARAPAKGSYFHSRLVRLARRAVAGLAYFQDREPDHKSHGISP